MRAAKNCGIRNIIATLLQVFGFQKKWLIILQAGWNFTFN
jgi:hypothetical protein